jgi:exopolyphosphatase/guanosine-5'-triphosphate,3'-diphosphate pyrophosphatase
VIRASIDLGTNTCLLLIADWNESTQQVVRVLGDYATVVRLGEGVDRAHQLQKVPMERTRNCLVDYAQKVRAVGVDPKDVIAVATSQARDAKNSGEFFDQVKKESGFSFRVISGEDEARFTFLGALLPGMNAENSAVVDIGGGSTEIISLGNAQSVDLGSVRFTERYLKSDPVTDEEFWACQAAIDEALVGFKMPLAGSAKPDLVAVAGTATTLAAWFLNLPQFDSTQVDEVVLTRGDVHRMVEDLKWRSMAERRLLPCMEPLRADVILAGALILWRVLEVLQFSECRVSTRGLRYGILHA